MILAYPFIAFFISIALKTNFITTIFLFLAIPSIYVTIKGKNDVKKSLVFALLVGISAVLLIDPIAETAMIWGISTIFPKLFGIIPLEQFVWGILFCYFIVQAYEVKFDKNDHKVLHERFKYFFLVAFLAFLAEVYYLIMRPNWEYIYILGGSILFLLPITSLLIVHLNFRKKFFKSSFYTAYLFLFFELAALINGNWFFPGKYIASILIMNHAFPLEEFIFFVLLGNAGVLTFYEFFDDDRK